MSKKGKLIVVSGFSGVGKGAIINSVINNNDNYSFSISATTREKRNGEENGVHYFFVTKNEFEEMIKKDELIEYAQYVDNYYGTPKKFVEEKLEQGENVILDIEMIGGLNIKKKFPDSVLIYILPPSANELKNRLINRGTEKKEVVDKRIEYAIKESEKIKYYDYVIVNDNLDVAVEHFYKIINGEENNSPSKYEDFINKIKIGLKEIV